MTDKQKQIFEYIADGELIKRDIVKQFQGWYYCNAAFHIGNILSRMVKAGLLERPRHGVYRKPTQHPDPDNQMQLF